MFIPRGKAIHENLATSYVRVDALVADLGEGGFSGIVEVVLRDTDSFVVINNGSVAGVLERRGPNENVVGKLHQDLGAATSTRTTLAKLSERSRLERGRVSVYAYPAEEASAVARRVNAKSLYVGLSTDFTDLEKMILKLVRERDREWFVDINTNGVPTALIHIRDGSSRILSSEEIPLNARSDSTESENKKALGRLLYQCNQPGTTFDVYFASAGEAPEIEADAGSAEVEVIPVSDLRSVERLAKGAHANAHASSNQWQASQLVDPMDTKLGREELNLSRFELLDTEPDGQEETRSSYNVRAAAAGHVFELADATPLDVTPASEPVSSMDSGVDSGLKLIDAEGLDSPSPTGIHSLSPGDEDMPSVKRLMGEIAKTIEEAAQAVDRPDSFSMSLRAGQLKIADRYPFLDPFASEIEYLAGEIVFVGQATVEEFIEGLTEALTLAVQAVMKSTAFADRFRAYLTEDLQKLRTRERQALQDLGLDRVIEQITRL